MPSKWSAMSSAVTLKRPGLRVWKALRQDIDSGAFSPGEALPSGRRLAERFGIARNTVRRVLMRLEEEGLVFRRNAHEYVVADETADSESASMAARVMNRTVAILTTTSAAGLRAGEMGPAAGRAIEVGAMGALEKEDRYCMPVDPNHVPVGYTLRLVHAEAAGFLAFPGDGPHEAFLAHIRALQERGAPVVLHGDCLEVEGVDQVRSDHALGSKNLTEWLFSRGRKRILRAWPEGRDFVWLRERDRGYEQACVAAGVSALPPIRLRRWTEEMPYTELAERAAASHAEALRPYLLGDNPVDAIMGISDGCLLDLANACRLLGKEPQRDVLLVGYDNYWNDPWMAPERRFVPAATVDKRNVETGQALARLLLERVAGALPPEPQTRWVEPRLEVVNDADTQSCRK